MDWKNVGWNQPPLPPTAWGRTATKTAQSARGSRHLYRKPSRLRPGTQAPWAQEYPAQALLVPGVPQPWAVKRLRDGLQHLHAKGDAQWNAQRGLPSKPPERPSPTPGTKAARPRPPKHAPHRSFERWAPAAAARLSETHRAKGPQGPLAANAQRHQTPPCIGHTAPILPRCAIGLPPP